MTKTNRNLRYFYSLAVVLTLHTCMVAQQSTHLPYSIFGIGELTSSGLGRNQGMGKSGFALASELHLNNSNPAANQFIDSLSFFFDMGLSGEFVNYRTATSEQQGNDVNLRNIAIGFRIHKRLSSGIGIAPYSRVGYKINSVNDVEGNQDSYLVEHTGSGGLNRFYWDNSIVLFKNFSFGVNVSYLFGNIVNKEKSVYYKYSYELFHNKTSYLNKLFMDFGIHYTIPIGDELKISLGGVYGNRHQLNFSSETEVYDNQGTIIDETYETEESFTFPAYYGGGIALNYSDKIILTGDYLFTQWSQTKTDNPYFSYSDANQLRFGVEYVPGGGLITDNYLGIVRYRAGFYYEQSYLSIENKDSYNRGITLGVGFPFLRNKTSLNISAAAGIRGRTDFGMIEERYVQVFLGLELHDWWFVKSRYY